MADQTQGIPDDLHPPISGDNLDPQVAQAAGIQDDQANPATGQGSAGTGQPAEPVPGGAGQPAPGYVNPPEGNAIQAGVQAAGTPLGPITPTGQSQTGAGGNPGVTQEDLSKTDISGSTPPSRVASMLMGEGAMTPQQTAAVVQSVDPGNTQPPGNRNMLALDALVQKGDTKGAVAFMQGQRMLFMPKQAMAYQATIGVTGKPADINAAIANANEAEQHVMDGSNVKFAHGDQGQITATVTMAGTGKPPQVIPLTVPQFQQFLNPKGDGQWDKLMNSTVPATLQAISSRDAATSADVDQAYGGAQAKPGQTASPEGETGGEEDNTAAPSKAVQTGKAQAMDVTQADQPAKPGQFDENGHFIGKSVKSFSDQQAEADQNGYGAELEKRSRQIFPDVGHEAARQQWMAAQEEKELERSNKIGVAAEKGKNENERAKIIGGARVQAAEVTGQYKENSAKIGADARKYVGDQQADARRQAAVAELQKRASIDRNAQQRNAAAVLGHQLQNLPLMSAEEQKQVTERADAFFAAGNPAAAPQVPAPTGRPAAPPSGKPDIHQQAIDWAKSHPDDPRAAQILQKNGM